MEGERYAEEGPEGRDLLGLPCRAHVPGAVSERFSGSIRRISARRAMAEACYRCVALAGALALAQVLELWRRWLRAPPPLQFSL
jgi:hypothetical protein